MLEVQIKIQAKVEKIRYSQVKDENTNTIVNDVNSVQIQSKTVDKNGKIERKTLKLMKVLKEEEMKKLEGKTLEFTEVTEHKFKEEGMNGYVSFSYSYTANQYKEIENKTGESMFNVLKSGFLSIINVIQENKRDYVTIQVEDISDDTFKIYDIKVRKQPIQLLKPLLNKICFFDKMSIKNTNNGLLIETETLPKPKQ